MNAPRRYQCSRKAGWTTPPGAIYVGRHKSARGRYGNPFAAITTTWHNNREVVQRYRDHLLWREQGKPHQLPPRYPTLHDIRTELGGHDLLCWCRLDYPCHADTDLALANGATLAALPALPLFPPLSALDLSTHMVAAVYYFAGIEGIPAPRNIMPPPTPVCTSLTQRGVLAVDRRAGGRLRLTPCGRSALTELVTATERTDHQ